MRLFAAIFPPKGVLDAVEPIARRTHREIPTKGAWVAPERMHTTLRFYGDRFRQEDCVRMVEDALRDTAPFTLRLTALDGFPASRLKRVLFLKPEENEMLAQILSRLSDPAERDNSPHLTFARFNQPVELPRIKFDPIEWRVDRVSLINSIQFGAEHRYSVVQEWPLAD
jgi:2'-5' RNA ligase